MKLIIAIVQDEDAGKLMTSLMNEGFSVTKLATTGGFLKAGNTTLLTGVEAVKLDKALDVIEKICKSRKQISTAPSPVSNSSGGYLPFPVEVVVGGATVFVLDVDQFKKVLNMNFSDIISANVQVKGLERSLYTDTIIQSLIFEGQGGTGKKMLADIYANALVCTQDQRKPCGRCKGCILFSSKNHPDIFVLSRGKKKSIGVDEIKSLQKEAIIKPNESSSKVFIIQDAHTLTAQAQNALLKLIEEPPSYLNIILLCSNTSSLLETIISRCSIIPMPYLSYENIVLGLMSKGIERDIARAIAQGANGSFGKALDRYNDTDYLKTREDLTDIFFLLEESKTKGYKVASQKKDNAKDMIHLWQSLVRDALIYKSGEIDNIENIDKIGKIETYAKAHNSKVLIRKLEALCDAEKRLYYNAQYKLVLDNLMTKI